VYGDNPSLTWDRLCARIWTWRRLPFRRSRYKAGPRNVEGDLWWRVL